MKEEYHKILDYLRGLAFGDDQPDNNPGWWTLLGILFGAVILLLCKLFTN